MATQYYYDSTFNLYAYRDNRHRLVVTQNEGYTGTLGSSDLIKAPRFRLMDERGEIVPPAGSTVQLAIIRPNRSEALVNCVIEQESSANTSYIKIPIHKSITAFAGDVQGEIRLITTNAVIKFYGVNFYVYDGVSDDAAEQSEAFSALIEKMQELALIIPAGNVNTLSLDTVIQHGGTNPVASGIIYDFISGNYVPTTRKVATLPLSGDITADDLSEAISAPKVYTGNVAPTSQTVGKYGDFFIVQFNSTSSNWIYQCKGTTDNNGTTEYVWARLAQNNDLYNLVPNTRTIAGIDLQDNITAQNLVSNLYNSLISYGFVDYVREIHIGTTDKSDEEQISGSQIYDITDIYINKTNGKMWVCSDLDSENIGTSSNPEMIWTFDWDYIGNLFNTPITTTLTVAVQDWDDNQYELPSALVTLADGRNKADVDIDSQTLNTLIGDGCIGLYVSTDTSGVSPVFTLNAIGNEPLHEITIQITFSQLIEVVQEVGE